MNKENELSDRLSALERSVEFGRSDAELRKGLQDVEVFVRKIQEHPLGAAARKKKGASFSTYTSACTSACFSSAACMCPSNSLAAAAQDPEVAGVFATLHKRGIEVLGEDAFMEAIIKEAENSPEVKNPFDTSN
jgi:hypothetical protein